MYLILYNNNSGGVRRYDGNAQRIGLGADHKSFNEQAAVYVYDSTTTVQIFQI